MKRAQWMMALIVTLLPTLAAAQLAGNQRIVTQVPFEFVAGNRILPPGQYAVESAVPNGTALMLRNVTAGVGIVSANSLDETSKASDTYALVFRKYGNQHFLWEVRIKGTRTTLRLPESRAEAELRAQAVPATAEILLASNQ